VSPLVIAHRGASGYLPEHTLVGKALAYGLGADYLEQDVIATRDAELVVLHDGADSSLVMVIFENEEDYQKGDEILSAMPAADTPGRRTSVQKYDVAMRMKS